MSKVLIVVIVGASEIIIYGVKLGQYIMETQTKIINMRRVAGRNSRGCRAIAISIQNINPSNLIGNSVILYVLNMDSLHLEIEERISNAIRGFVIEIKVEKQMKKSMCKVLYSHILFIVVKELLSRMKKYITILPSLTYYSSSYL